MKWTLVILCCLLIAGLCASETVTITTDEKNGGDVKISSDEDVSPSKDKIKMALKKAQFALKAAEDKIDNADVGV
ncbi:hypothetical protein V1264_025007 [Littorina saxatilis]|uniref:Uncharacterized protein n=1 Tax=Littorina saxatilis TaxID=31220 RepID=A0AAN9AMW7_9CAEN